MNAWADIAPVTPSRISVYSLARRVREEVQLAMELAIDGPHCDVPRAQAHLDRARALLGPVSDGDA
jgi:hypothetical protein